MWIAALVLLAQAGDPFAAAEKHLAAGAYAQALGALGAAPDSARKHLIASKAHDGLGHPAQAVEECEAALALEPKSEAAHLQLGQIFLANNTPEGALEVFSEALDVVPGSLLLRLGKGLALKDLARYPEAETELAAVLERKPDFSLAFDALATVYLHSKRFEDLQTLAGAYAARNPGDYRGPYFRAAALEGLRRPAAAVEVLLDASLRMNPKFAAAHALLGKTRLQAGDAKGAIAPLETALKLRPDHAPAALHLAQAFQKCGREEEAVQAFRWVRELKEREQQPRPSLRYHRGKQ
ncbi:MAG: tetratricopeptide repeat protein [Bryobacteraceae bacterium]